MAVQTVRRSPEFVQSVARAVAVIKAFSREQRALTISEVAHRTDLSRAAARRFLFTLQRLGYVEAADGSFRLSPRVLDLGFTFLSTSALPDAAQPVMEEVVAKLHESCSVSVLDSADIVYVARVPTRRIMTVGLAVGSRLPAHATSMGRVLLAHLAPEALDAWFAHAAPAPLTPRTVCDEAGLRQILRQVREQGWALVDQEVEEGVRSIAAPIRDRSSRVLAAVNVSAHATRATVRKLRESYLPELIAAARRISAALGASA